MICPKHNTGGGPCYCNGPRKHIAIKLRTGHTIDTNEFTCYEDALKALGLSAMDVRDYTMKDLEPQND